jgi:hypothetical protein
MSNWKSIGPATSRIDNLGGNFAIGSSGPSLEIVNPFNPSTPMVFGKDTGHTIIVTLVTVRDGSLLNPDPILAPNVDMCAVTTCYPGQPIGMPPQVPAAQNNGYRIGVKRSDGDNAIKSFTLQQGESIGPSNNQLTHDIASLFYPKRGDAFTICYTWDASAGMIRLWNSIDGQMSNQAALGFSQGNRAIVGCDSYNAFFVNVGIYANQLFAVASIYATTNPLEFILNDDDAIAQMNLIEEITENNQSLDVIKKFHLENWETYDSRDAQEGLRLWKAQQPGVLPFAPQLGSPMPPDCFVRPMFIHV